MRHAGTLIGLLCVVAVAGCAPAPPTQEAADSARSMARADAENLRYWVEHDGKGVSGQELLDHLLAVVAEPNRAFLLDQAFGADGSATVTVYYDATATAGGGLFTADAGARLCVDLTAVPGDPGTVTVEDAPCAGEALPRLPDGSREVTLDGG
ncbi:hypothetical protein [Cellulomonas sp.]|uniref:hypothetical protein n=1 Tax=Cellulomonas sp. TaxID=40001 RepID=UPI001B1F427F|nr:hypothetical protein [Cellulomonas sp.]MBO9555293.1 hypothetical protein [Cellulomonas sp.]